MRKLRGVVVIAMCLTSIAGAATLAEIETLVEEANSALRAGGGDRAASLREAIKKCKRALELLDEVDGISDEVRDKKSSEILSTLYWCKKMMPMDLHGRQKVGAAGKGGPKPEPEKEGASSSRKPAPVRSSKEHDKIAYELAAGYASRAPQDLEGIVIRYEGVAALYPNTKWGQKAQDEAARTRAKLERTRLAAVTSSKELVERLRYDDALAAIEKQKLQPRMKANAAALDQLAEDVRSLRRLHAKVIDALTLRQVSLDIPFSELGLKKTGWLIRGNADGLDVIVGDKKSPKTRWSWGDLGARGMVLLGKRFVTANNAEWTELVAVGATIVEEYIIAHELFGKLLIMAPERANRLTGHFQRATSGYKSSGEGRTAIQLSEAKNLVRKRKYEEAFVLLNGLRTSLASNSEMVDKLHEVNDYRRGLMLKKGLNERGLPISLFEKKVRAAFGGDVKLDEDTGRIEVTYDFSDKRQLRDFGIAYLYGQWKRSSSGFTISKGQLHALGRKLNVFWKFPVAQPDVQVDVTYYTKKGRFELSINNQKPGSGGGGLYGGYGMYDRTIAGFNQWEAGRVSSYSGQIYSYSSSFREKASMLWRPGEPATLRLMPSEFSSSRSDLFFNGDWVGYCYDYGESKGGGIGFGFNGGKGAIDNIVIRGRLDMAWFDEYTSKIRR